MVRVYEVNDLYVDAEGHKAVTGYFVAADTLTDALARAATVSTRIQINSGASMLIQRLIIDGSASSLRTTPGGTVRRRLHVLMGARSAGDPVEHEFAIFVFDPNPDMLNSAKTRVDKNSAAWQDFVDSVLSLLVDIHGHAFNRVIQAFVEQS